MAGTQVHRLYRTRLVGEIEDSSSRYAPSLKNPHFERLVMSLDMLAPSLTSVRLSR